MGDWKGGDFGGVTQKINDGYFDSMGVNTLWLSSPVLGTKLCEMGAGANSGHCLSGYHSYFPIASGWTYGSESDPSFASQGITSPIEPHFGVTADLVALVNAAHQHGIRVLTDLVVNHVFADPSPPSGQAAQLAPLSVAHQTDLAWFNIPYSSAYNDCGSQNLWDTPTSQTWNRADCWFDPYLPDFNSTNPSVNDKLADHAVWLMEQFNLDGFRVDAVKQVTNKICVDMRSKIDAAISTKLPFYMVGEALGGVVANVMDCVGTDRLDGSMDDPLHNTIVGTILQNDSNAGNDLDNGVLYDEATWSGAVSTALMGHFFGSHDTPRAISLAAGEDVGNPWTNPPPATESNAGAFNHLRLAHAFLLTYNPIPIVWMGDEFGHARRDRSGLPADDALRLGARRQRASHPHEPPEARQGTGRPFGVPPGDEDEALGRCDLLCVRPSRRVGHRGSRVQPRRRPGHSDDDRHQHRPDRHRHRRPLGNDGDSQRRNVDGELAAIDGRRLHTLTRSAASSRSRRARSRVRERSRAFLGLLHPGR